MKPRWSSRNASSKRGNGEYRSKQEGVVAEALGLSGHPFSYESTKLPYVKHHNYLADFSLPSCHIEVKGYWPAEDRSKMLAVVRCNPGAKVVMVLIKPELTISKTSKATYSQWCDRNGIAWCKFESDPVLLKARLETLLAPRADAAQRSGEATGVPAGLPAGVQGAEHGQAEGVHAPVAAGEPGQGARPSTQDPVRHYPD